MFSPRTTSPSQLVLAREKTLQLRECANDIPRPNEILIRVEACGICKTDAKMWAIGEKGQPDLRLPRVLGHEFVGLEVKTGERFVVWPGVCCDTCESCLSGHENLCSSLGVMGFHIDGGLSSFASVPRASVLPAPTFVDASLLTLAEPLACTLHALNLSNMNREKSLAVVGGGTLGVLTALAASRLGLRPTICEHDNEKISRLLKLGLPHLPVVQRLSDLAFDFAINAASSADAFLGAMIALKKGGTLLYFSGIAGGESVSLSVLNLAHYRELRILGTYGCTRADMSKAIEMLKDSPDLFAPLVEENIDITQVENNMERVLSGKEYRLVCRFL